MYKHHHHDDLLCALDNDPGCIKPDFCGIPEVGLASLDPDGAFSPDGRGRLICKTISMCMFDKNKIIKH